MTYLKNGVEYLDDDETRVLRAIRDLNAAKRTTNSSQVASITGMPRTRVAVLTRGLSARKYIKNVGKGAAYHWRLTGKKPGANDHGRFADPRMGPPASLS